MISAARIARADLAARPDPLEVFKLRAWARAKLYQAGELTLHDAVDELQADAVRDGLVAELGQDEVQRIMAEAFGAVREDELNLEETDGSEDAWSAPGWRAAAIKYHDDRAGRAGVVEMHEAEVEGRAAASTIEALMIGLRERGIAAVQEPKVRGRLAQLSEAQVIEVGDRLQRQRVRAWSSDGVAALVNAWEEARS